MKQVALALTLGSTLAANYQQCDPCDQSTCCDPCGLGVFVDGQFLYWYSTESQLPLAVEFASRVTNPTDSFRLSRNTPKKTHYLDSTWDPGFRVGIGYAPPCLCWNTSLYWTSLRSSNTNTLNTEATTPFLDGLPDGSKAFYSPWNYGQNVQVTLVNGAETFVLPFPVILQEVASKWSLDYDMFDLKFGLDWHPVHCCELVSYFGVKGGFTNIKFSQDMNGESTAFVNFSESFQNRFNGVGLMAGFEPSFQFFSCLGLYGRLEGALLWGEYKIKRSEAVLLDPPSEDAVEYTNTYKTKTHDMQDIFTFGIGLRYQDSFWCDRLHVLLDLGWEHQLLNHHVIRPQIDNPVLFEEEFPSVRFLSQNFSGVTDLITDLSLGGFVLRLQLGY